MLSFLAKFRQVFVEKSYWHTCLHIIFHPWIELYLQMMSGRIEMDIFFFLLSLKCLLYSKQPITVHFSLAIL